MKTTAAKPSGNAYPKIWRRPLLWASLPSLTAAILITFAGQRALAQSAQSGIISWKADAFSGHRHLVDYFYMCDGSYVEYEVTKSPLQGEIEVTRQPTKFLEWDCPENGDRIAGGVAIWYTPRPDFVGKDAVGFGYWMGRDGYSRHFVNRQVTFNVLMGWKVAVSKNEPKKIDTLWNCDGSVTDVTWVQLPSHGNVKSNRRDVDTTELRCRHPSIGPVVDYIYTPDSGYTGPDHLEFFRKRGTKSGVEWNRPYVYDINVQ